MLRTIAFLLLIAGGAVFAQQPDAKTKPAAASPSIKAGPAQPDAKKLEAKIKASYYHPDTLPGLSCSVNVDFERMFASMNTQAPAARMKALKSLRIKVKALRNQKPVIAFSWENSAPLENAEQMLGGLRQMIDGHFQTYWSILASSSTAEMVKESTLTPGPDGTVIVTATTNGMEVSMTVDKDGLPTHYTVHTGGTATTMDPHYTDSPQPKPGDLRRIATLDVIQEIGTNKSAAVEAIDYQTVDVYFVPQHLTVTVGGALIIPMEFTDCTIVDAEK